MTVSQKVIKETIQMLRNEWEFQHDVFEREQAVTPHSIDTHKALMGMDTSEYFARQIADIFKRDNPAFDEKKFFNLCGMSWLA